MVVTFSMKNRDPTKRQPPVGHCIYCGSTRYREKDDRELGEEHVIAESLGGSLALKLAACEDCERRVNDFEQPILKTILYAPRVFLGVRRKRRKRGEETVKVQGRVGGKDVDIVLPIKNVPAMLLLLNLGSPGILIGRPIDIAEVRGAWFKHLSSGAPVPPGFEAFSSPILDTFKFAQMLAKIAHCFAIATLADGFDPMLVDFIREKANSPRYDLVGGMSGNEPPSENLHELELKWQKSSGINYVLVKIRLFASLGAPTYVVVVGKAKAS
jgi:hypothetical protein